MTTLAAMSFSDYTQYLLAASPVLPSSPAPVFNFSIGGVVSLFIWIVQQIVPNMTKVCRNTMFLTTTCELGVFAWMMFLGRIRSAEEIIAKLLSMALMAYVFFHFNILTKILVDSFMSIPNIAFGSPSNTILPLTPDSIMGFWGALDRSFNIVQTGLAPVLVTTGVPFTNIPALFADYVAHWMIWIGMSFGMVAADFAALFAFLILAIELALAECEFQLVYVISYFTYPFSAFEPLKFVGEKAIPAIFGQAVKLGVVALLVTVEALTFAYYANPSVLDQVLQTSVKQMGWVGAEELKAVNEGLNNVQGLKNMQAFYNTFLQNYAHLSPAKTSKLTLDQSISAVSGMPGLSDYIMSIVAMSVLMIFLAFQVPTIASSFLTGLPGLSAGGFFKAAEGVVRTAAAVKDLVTGGRANGMAGNVADIAKNVSSIVQGGGSGGGSSSSGGGGRVGTSGGSGGGGNSPPPQARHRASQASYNGAPKPSRPQAVRNPKTQPYKKPVGFGTGG